MDLIIIFFILGMIVLVGVSGRYLQNTKRIPESLFLILLGLFLGPITGLIPEGTFMPFLPFISTLAMIGILLESGLDFKLQKLDKDLTIALTFIVLVAVFTTLSVGSLLYFVFKWDPLVSLLIGLISSGTTTLTARVLLEITNAHIHVKRIITLESIFNDITLVFGASVLLAVMANADMGQEEILKLLFGRIAVALLLGAAAGWFWKVASEVMATSTKLRYISTFGFAIFLYPVSSFFGGDPILSIFGFSLILGNYDLLQKHIKGKDRFKPILEDIKNVQVDFTFFLRTFFFFVLGTTFSFSLLKGPALVIVGGIILMIILSRLISAMLISNMDNILSTHKFLVTMMIPRGFVATVLSFLPAQKGITIPYLTEIVLLLVFTSTFLSMAGAYLYGAKKR